MPPNLDKTEIPNWITCFAFSISVKTQKRRGAKTTATLVVLQWTCFDQGTTHFGWRSNLNIYNVMLADDIIGCVADNVINDAAMMSVISLPCPPRTQNKLKQQ